MIIYGHYSLRLKTTHKLWNITNTLCEKMNAEEFCDYGFAFFEEKSPAPSWYLALVGRDLSRQDFQKGRFSSPE